MVRNKHPASKAERIELEKKHRESKKKSTGRVKLKEQIKDQETQDELRNALQDGFPA